MEQKVGWGLFIFCHGNNHFEAFGYTFNVMHFEKGLCVIGAEYSNNPVSMKLIILVQLVHTEIYLPFSWGFLLVILLHTRHF